MQIFLNQIIGALVIEGFLSLLIFQLKMNVITSMYYEFVRNFTYFKSKYLTVLI